MTRGTKSKSKKAANKAAAIARGPKRGLAAFYAPDPDRAKKRAEIAAQRLAHYGNGWAFGARAEAQFLALARFLADLAELDAATPKGRTGEELATIRKKQLLRQVRQARALGRNLQIFDAVDVLSFKTGEIAPGAGSWEPVQWEPGRFDLVGPAWHPGEGIAVANVPGDVRQGHGERSREIRWYHARGADTDPSGAPYTRLGCTLGLTANGARPEFSTIGQTLPLSILKQTVCLLVQKWGNDPIAWPGFEKEAAQYRPDTAGEAGPV